MSAPGPVLREIHVPTAAWWPLAPGWWVVVVVAVLLVAAVAVWLWRRARRGVLQAVLQEIDGLETTFERSHDTAAMVAGASRLLRRVAMRVDRDAAAAHGDTWRTFLRRYARDLRAEALFDELVDAPFRVSPDIDARALPDALRGWCRRALASSHAWSRVQRLGRESARNINARNKAAPMTDAP